MSGAVVSTLVLGLIVSLVAFVVRWTAGAIVIDRETEG